VWRWRGSTVSITPRAADLSLPLISIVACDHVTVPFNLRKNISCFPLMLGAFRTFDFANNTDYNGSDEALMDEIWYFFLIDFLNS
jgi:hypothetical protein